MLDPIAEESGGGWMILADVLTIFDSQLRLTSALSNLSSVYPRLI